MTSTLVTISIILNGSQLDTESLIQVERNEKAFKRIQKKMMRTRSTLYWSQSNNISCNHLHWHGFMLAKVNRLLTVRTRLKC